MITSFVNIKKAQERIAELEGENTRLKADVAQAHAQLSAMAVELAALIRAHEAQGVHEPFCQELRKTPKPRLV